jgi:hypothetical protein
MRACAAAAATRSGSWVSQSDTAGARLRCRAGPGAPDNLPEQKAARLGCQDDAADGFKIVMLTTTVGEGGSTRFWEKMGMLPISKSGRGAAAKAAARAFDKKNIAIVFDETGENTNPRRARPLGATTEALPGATMDRCGDLCIERQLAAPMRHIAPLLRHPSIETPKTRAMCARHF